jgi:prolipoprotein diacylglyceryltransferase
LGKEYVFGGVWMRAPDTGNIGYHVPTQLYESLFLFVLFAILSILYFKRYNILMQIYLISYGVWRFLIEYVRTDQVGGVQDALLRPSQWQSIIFISIGILLFVIYHIRRVPLKQQK